MRKRSRTVVSGMSEGEARTGPVPARHGDFESGLGYCRSSSRAFTCHWSRAWRSVSRGYRPRSGGTPCSVGGGANLVGHDEGTGTAAVSMKLPPSAGLRPEDQESRKREEPSRERRGGEDSRWPSLDRDASLTIAEGRLHCGYRRFRRPRPQDPSIPTFRDGSPSVRKDSQGLPYRISQMGTGTPRLSVCRTMVRLIGILGADRLSL